MKKIIALILVSLMLVLLVACDGIGKVTITFEDGTTESTSLKKIVRIYEEDTTNFFEKYPEGTVITFRDKIDSFINDELFIVESGINVKLKSGTVESLYGWNDEDDVVEISGEIIEDYGSDIQISLNSITLII